VSQPELANYEVLVGVCGGIAAYKVCEVVSRLVQRGAGVTVAMTAGARHFVAPLTFQALSGREVLTDVWDSERPGDVQHIALTSAADVVLIAPATANIIGKIASGIADDVVTTLVIAATSPIILAPAMNERMWKNPLVQQNVAKLHQLGYGVVGPGDGWLACRTVGPGRMVESDELFEALVTQLRAKPPKGVRSREA
jgi:phosphopantothenoylcysteine decarboxylase/phosphopantothenate--cysteine ligase